VGVHVCGSSWVYGSTVGNASLRLRNSICSLGDLSSNGYEVGLPNPSGGRYHHYDGFAFKWQYYCSYRDGVFTHVATTPRKEGNDAEDEYVVAVNEAR
jgi:hypothetical protein